jgi:hypothetical protein
MADKKGSFTRKWDDEKELYRAIEVNPRYVPASGPKFWHAYTKADDPYIDSWLYVGLISKQGSGPYQGWLLLDDAMREIDQAAPWAETRPLQKYSEGEEWNGLSLIAESPRIGTVIHELLELWVWALHFPPQVVREP